MCNNGRRHIAVVIVAGVFSAAFLREADQAQPSRQLPEGKGVEIVRAKCLGCHESDMIQQQRLTRTGWQRELDKMIRWGASVNENDRENLIAYLTTNFAGAVDATSSPSASGSDVFQRRCVGCHGVDIVAQQRLASAAWDREIDKMTRWGANVSSDEKKELVEYLSTQFGPRQRTYQGALP